MSDSALPLPQAAAELGVSVSTLRRMLREGAPQARRGARGRGRVTLVDPRAVAAWRGSPEACVRLDVAAIPELIAAAIAETFDQAQGLPKQRVAGVMVAAWYAASLKVMDHLRATEPSVPDVRVVPLSIERLRKIATL